LVFERDVWTRERDRWEQNSERCGVEFEERGPEKETEMKLKLAWVVAVLSCAPLAIAADKAAYPTENVVQFVVEKLDVTSLPSAFRPKKEKAKKTFADYGFSSHENHAIIEAAGGAERLVIKVLDQTSKGIYVCFADPGQNGGEPKTQSVVHLKRKDPNALLKGRESFREFAACPVIGRTDSAADSYGGD
jgi:hypothetical protein